MAAIPFWGWVFVVAPLLGLLILPFWLHSEWQSYRRQGQISAAIQQMTGEERNEWSNVCGRYRDRRCIPRTLPPAFMTVAERHRWSNDLAEFTPDGEAYREPTSFSAYD